MTRTWTANVTLDYSAGNLPHPRQLVFWVEFSIDEDQLNGEDARDEIVIHDWSIEKVIAKGESFDATNSVFAFAFSGLFGDAIEEWSPLLDRVLDQCLKSARGEIEHKQTPQPLDELTLTA